MITFLPIALITLLVIAAKASSETDSAWHVVESEEFPDAVMRFMISEGLSNDGENFIVNSKDHIYLLTADLQTILAENKDAIPHALREKYGYNHLGDCQYVNGVIYFPVEEPSYSQPAIFVYNVSTTNSGIEIDFSTFKAQSVMRHMPWIALEERTNVLYSSEFSDVKEIFAFDATTLNYLRTMPLDVTLQDVQGGAFYNGSLFLGVNGKDTIYEVDVSTGAVDAVFKQAADDLVPREYEFEGLTFLDLTHVGKGIMHNTGNQQLPNRLVHSDFI